MKDVHKNGRLYRDRVCPECGKKHFHSENMCIKCRNTQQANRRNKSYIKISDTQYADQQKQRLAVHEKRIAAEMIAIEKAGLSPKTSSVYEILAAGVILDETVNYSAFEKIAL